MTFEPVDLGPYLRCPACGRSEWLRGRETWNVYQCGFCEAKATLADGLMQLISEYVACGSALDDHKADRAFRSRPDPLRDHTVYGTD